MPTYITLLRCTSKGLENVKESPSRLDAARKMLKSSGVTLKDFYMVTGRYSAARLSTLLYQAQFFLVLGCRLRLDPLFRPPFSHSHHSIRSTPPLPTLLLVSPLLQPSPLEPR